MSEEEKIFSLSKNEIKLFSALVMYGAQTIKELALNADLSNEKAESNIIKLQEKGFIQIDEETGIYSYMLPVSKIINLLDESTKIYETNHKDQIGLLQGYRKLIEEELEKFREVIDEQCRELKESNDQLQISLKENLNKQEQQRIEKSNEHTNELISNYSIKTTEAQTTVQSNFITENNRFETKWEEVKGGLQNISDIGIRTYQKSIKSYEQELSNVIRSASEKVTSLNSLLTEVVNAIETESISRIKDFFSITQSTSEEIKNNLHMSLNESQKHEKEFINEIKQRNQNELTENITKSLNKVIENLINDLDNDINESLNNIKIQTEEAIIASSKQIKNEFNDFAEGAAELLQEQKSSIDVLSTELSELSSEEKLERSLNAYSQQLKTLLTTELTTLEANYRRAQKTTFEIIENIRRSTKNKLMKQNQDFENLINSLKEIQEKFLERRDQDLGKIQQLSQSVENFLKNLLISIPMRSNQYKTSLKGSIGETIQGLQEGIGETTKGTVSGIYDQLSNSQQRIENAYKETFGESEKEIKNVINLSEQLNTSLSNLYDSYAEKIERRFEQRAKVMNTELEAISRNFQNVLNGIESSVGNINDRFTSEASVINIETSLQNSVVHLKNEFYTLFTQNQADSQELASQLDVSMQNHLDNTLELIKNGFNTIREDFHNEVTTRLTQINSRNEEQQKRLVDVIDSFSNQNVEKFTEFKTNLTKFLEENQTNITLFVDENRRSVDEVINLHKSNISRYQEKGPTDILSFINQIETEVSTHNKNIKDTLEELLSFYDGLSDSTMTEVSGILLQVHESGDKLSAIFEDSLQQVATGLTKVHDQIDMYFSDSMTEFENQIGVATGFVTSEVGTSVKTIQEEILTYKEDFKESIEKLNSELKDLVTQQENEFQKDLPEFSNQFSQAFDELINERTSFNQDLETKLDENLSALIDNWNKQIHSTKDKLNNITNALGSAITENTENLDTIVSKNVEEATNRLKNIYNLDLSKENIFGLKEIQTKVKQANKRLRTATIESLSSHVDNLDQQISELVTSYDAIHIQTEEDLNEYLEDLSDLISSSQMALNKQLHDYLKEERDKVDFSEIKEDLKNLERTFSQKTSQDTELFSAEFEASISKATSDIENSREGIQELFRNLSQMMTEQNKALLTNLENIKTELVQSLEERGDEVKKDIDGLLDSFSNNLDKLSLELSGKSAQFTQNINEELEKQLTSVTQDSSELLKTVSSKNKTYLESLKELDEELSRIDPINNVRLVKLANDEAKVEIMDNLIKTATKQVTIFASNPTFLSLDYLKSIPSEKRIWIFTNYDFTKKGKKWLTEVSEQVNINLRQAKTSKLTGIMVVQDETSALILPDSLGYITTDSKFVTYLLGLLNQLKGAPIRKI